MSRHVVSGLLLQLLLVVDLARSETIMWAYTDLGEGRQEGPGDWGKTFPECNGEQQSPVDVKSTRLSPGLGDLGFSCDKVFRGGKLVNTQMTVRYDGAEGTCQLQALGVGGEVEEGEQSYTLSTLHFHAPSEHIIDGVPADLEVHFVHKSPSGALAVVGVLFTTDSSSERNKWLAALFSPGLPKTPFATDDLPGALNAGVVISPAEVQVDPTHEIPTGDFVNSLNKEFVAYTGSLTTPPCSEGVNWHLFTTPVKIPKSQVDEFKTAMRMATPELMYSTARPVQTINDRVFYTNKKEHDKNPIGTDPSTPRRGNGSPGGMLLSIALLSMLICAVIVMRKRSKAAAAAHKRYQQDVESNAPHEVVELQTADSESQ